MHDLPDMLPLVSAEHYAGMDDAGLCAVRARAEVDGTQPGGHLRAAPAVRGGAGAEATGVGDEARYRPCGPVLCDGMTAHVQEAHWSFVPSCAGCGRAQA